VGGVIEEEGKTSSEVKCRAGSTGASTGRNAEAQNEFGEAGHGFFWCLDPTPTHFSLNVPLSFHLCEMKCRMYL